MGLQDFVKDAKNILLGNAEDENKEDFKQAIEEALKSGLIDKAQATVLMESVKKVKEEAKKLDKKQISTISLEDGSEVSEEDVKKKKEELARKKEEERKRRLASQNINKYNEEIIKQNDVVNDNKRGLKVDRKKLQQEMLKDEKEENLIIHGRDGKN